MRPQAFAITVAQADPAMPSPTTNIIIGFMMMLTTEPIIIPVMAYMAAPSARIMTPSEKFAITMIEPAISGNR